MVLSAPSLLQQRGGLSGCSLGIKLRHLANGLAKANWRDAEESGADEREGEELRPDDIQRPSTIDDALRKLTKWVVGAAIMIC